MSHCSRSWGSELGGRRAAAALVRGFLNGLVLRADTIGESELLSAKSIEALENLGALLRQILEGGGESAQKLGARVGAGLRLEVRDRRLDVGGRNPPLRHFGLQIRDVAFIAPALRIEIERGPAQTEASEKVGVLIC